MQSAKVSAATLKGYTADMKNYIIKPLGEMYMEEVTADDIRLAFVPLSKKSEGLYSKVNMLLKCVFYSAERSQILQCNPCVGIFIVLGLYSGLRREEILALQWDCVFNSQVLGRLPSGSQKKLCFGICDFRQQRGAVIRLTISKGMAVCGGPLYSGA